MVQLNVFVLSALVAFSVATELQKCPEGFDLTGTEVQDCENKGDPCELEGGSNGHPILIYFKTGDSTVADVKNKVTASLFGRQIEYKGVRNGSLCDFLSAEIGGEAECPLKPNTKYFYSDNFAVPGGRKVSTTITWSLTDGEGNLLQCFKIPIKIT